MNTVPGALVEDFIRGFAKARGKIVNRNIIRGAIGALFKQVGDLADQLWNIRGRKRPGRGGVKRVDEQIACHIDKIKRVAAVRSRQQGRRAVDIVKFHAVVIRHSRYAALRDFGPIRIAARLCQARKKTEQERRQAQRRSEGNPLFR